LRWKHVEHELKHTFGVETITEEIYNNPDVQEFIDELYVENHPGINKWSISCDFCHADTKEHAWNCRTFRFKTFEASFGIVGKGGKSFRAGIVYVCNDCASDIEEDDWASMLDRAAANLTIEFKHEVNRAVLAEMLEKFIENRIK